MEITAEVINQALELDERIQFTTLLALLKERKVLTSSQQKKYDEYRAKIGKFLNPTAPAEEEEVGIPHRLRVKRHYTMSAEALEQRRKVTGSPAKAEAMQGNRNAFRHGMYARSFIAKMRPCKSTCARFPCELVEEGQTEPGEDCLDKAEVLHNYRAVRKAIEDKDTLEFNDLAALQIANAISVVSMLTQDLMRDGPMVKREKRDGKGNIIVEFVPHPTLASLPKLIADLGLTPSEFLITPRSKSRSDSDKEGALTLADLITRAGKALGKE